MERVRSSRQNWCTDFIDGESYTTDFRSWVFQKKRPSCILTRASPRSPQFQCCCGMLLPQPLISAQTPSPECTSTLRLGGAGGYILSSSSEIEFGSSFCHFLGWAFFGIGQPKLTNPPKSRLRKRSLSDKESE